MKIFLIRVLITWSVFWLPLGASAHQPDLSSTILVDQGEKWVLQIRAALTAFEYEIENHYGDSAYVSPEEFQFLVIDYIKEHTTILFNEDQVAILQDGNVKLGHETIVNFQITGTPEATQSLIVKNNSFRNISRNKSVLMVLKKGFSRDQFVLNNDNEHTAKLTIRDAEFILTSPSQKKTQYYLLIVTIAMLAISVIYFAYKKKQALEVYSS